MDIFKRDLVVITAHLKHLSKTENAKRQASLLADVLDLVKFDASVLCTSGTYNHTPEESFTIVMPEYGTNAYDRIQSGVFDIGNKYEQECFGLVMNEKDPQTAVFVPLANADEDQQQYIEHPWIEISEEEAVHLDQDYGGYTKILDKFFTADEDSDVTPDIIKLLEMVRTPPENSFYLI